MNPRKLFILVLLSVNCGFCLFLIKALPAQWKIDIREILFAFEIKDENYLDAPPSNDFGFRQFQLTFIEKLLDKHPLPKMEGLENLELTEKAKKIALSFSKNGGEKCGTYSDNLVENINWLSKDDGNGCCSDHAQVFNAIAILNGMYPREVSHRSHTFNEFYDFDRQKWVWIDSQFCLLAKNQDGEYLSLHEIQQEFRSRKKIQWEFFGTPLHKIYGTEPEKVSTYFQASEFDIIKVTMGNNVFEEDYYNHSFIYVPREIRHFGLLCLKIKPLYGVVSTGDHFGTYLAAARSVVAALVLYAVLLNCVVVVLFGGLMRKRC